MGREAAAKGRLRREVCSQPAEYFAQLAEKYRRAIAPW